MVGYCCLVWVWIYIVDIVDVIDIVDVGYFWLDIWCGFVPPEVPAQPFLPAASLLFHYLLIFKRKILLTSLSN